MRNRDLYELYEISFRDRYARDQVRLVWAHAASYALQHLEETEDHVSLHSSIVIRRVREPDSNSVDYAETAWSGGERYGD